jgi:tRNA threonylcarbamoyladenosine biosynthesis protein TsaB
MPPADAPRLLALDTATETLAVAVTVGERTWAAQEEGGARASQRALPLAFELLAQSGLAPRELQAVAFGRGPGAFTGLRTACSLAQGLALGIGGTVLAIDSLLIVAEDAHAQGAAAGEGDEIWVAMDARMDEVYAGAWRREAGGWTATRAPALWTLPALNAAWAAAPPRGVAGSAIDAFGARLALSDAARVPRQISRAGGLARLARAAWQRGEAMDAALALPLYLRDKVALTTAERVAAKAAVSA